MLNVSLLLAASLLFAGCSRKNESSTAPAPSPQPASVNATSSPVTESADTETHPVATTPVIQIVWQQGRREAAVNAFLEANWTARPIFPAGMAMGLTDAQMKGLPDTERQLRANEMMAQVGFVGQLITAVSDAAQEAISKGDTARARKCYLALQQFGAALDVSENQPMVKHLGSVARNMAKLGLAKLGP